MKRTFQFLSAFAVLALLATGCSKEETGNGQPVNNDDKGLVRLTLTTDQVNTRAGEADTEPTTGQEANVDASKGLTVAVFNEDGSFSYGGDVDLSEDTPGVYTSEAIPVDAGNLFFFVFANNDGDIAAPAGGNIDGFMAQVLDVVYTGNNLDIAENAAGGFLLGSLWRQSTLAPAGGTDAEPKVVTIPAIGRLSSKVVLGTVALDVTGTLGGEFSDAEYRPGAVATGISYVGIHKPTVPTWDGLDLPYGTNTGILVTSAKHTVPYAAADYKSDFTWATATAPFYVTENTTGRDPVSNLQYYGNTTYIQVKTTYTPVVADLSKIEEATPGDGDFVIVAETAAAPAKGTTFYAAFAGSDRYLFLVQPTAAQVAYLSLTGLVEYTNGLNYHKFPVVDQEEVTALSDAVIYNRVLRNHHYTFNITGIKDLGDWSETVDPTEPITEKTTVEFTVEVANWDKVTGNIEL